ncbi:MAG: DUF4105 domain-containing protein [Planctomycetes bacterium]|nr:DUF4105 domain-containing protein [Planctomycetota bacterium]
MSRLRIFWLAAVIVWLSGCRLFGPPGDALARLDQLDPLASLGRLDTLAPLDQIELPSPKLNPDLVKTLQPSNDRNWSPDQAVLPYAEFHGDQVTVHNIRNCTYRTADDYTVTFYDKTFELGELDSVDFIMVPFADLPGVGHTMLSFGFGGRDYLAVSVEIRREKGEQYSPAKAALHQYELMYVVGDERDLIGLRANYQQSEVYVYRTRATPEQARALLVDVMLRANKLAQEPEFYDLLTNNCTTNIVRHVNQLASNRVPYEYRVLLPGFSDQLAYDLGLLDTDTSFAQTKLRARVNRLAYQNRDAADFSQMIRR